MAPLPLQFLTLQSIKLSMRLSDFLVDECVLWEIKAQDKWEFFDEVARCLGKALKLPPAEIKRVLEERERLSSTAIGEEIAIPHSRLADLERLVIAVGIKKTGLEFEALDKRPVKLVFVVLAPENDQALYLRVLAQLARLLKRQEVRERLLSASSAKELRKILAEVDEEG